MSRFIISPQARQDLLDIRDYIARDSSESARRVLAALRSSFAKLAEMPEIGHLREDAGGEPLRFWLVYPYLVVYRPHSKPLQIVRVLHGAREIGNLL